MSTTAPLPVALAEFNAAFDEYRKWNRRAPGEVIRARGTRVRIKLHRAFKALAPSRERIQSEAEARGFAITRRSNPTTGDTLTYAQELRARFKSRLFLSVSFLFRDWKAQSEGRYAARTRASQRIGEALVHTGPDASDPFVSLTSYLSGVVAQNAQRGIAADVLRAETADMGEYIARKSQEALGAHFQRLYTATLPAPV